MAGLIREGRVLPYYRLYHFQKGSIRTFDELEAADDEEAMAIAKRLAVGELSELWQRGRQVASFPPRGGKA
jgi:hypothetical protein